LQTKLPLSGNLSSNLSTEGPNQATHPPKMVLEATMIVVDNSEPARNGDYVPSRWEAQRDAANLIFHTKTQSNPESSVGLLSMGGSGPEVLTTLTTNFGNILDGLHRTKIGGGGCFFGRGVNIASLALKHRQNKSQRQRVVVFVCSPIEEDKGSLVKLAKRMKKIGLSIDIVAFGDLTDDNLEKLQAFNEAIKGSDGSHLEIVQPSGNLLSDVIVASPILAGDNANGVPGGGAANGVTGADGGAGGGGDFEFGVDPNVDPELALVLRMSMQEEEERQRLRREQDSADAKPNLESVPEEGKEEEQPLLNANGEASGSGDVEKEDEKKDGEGGDKMDTV
jgi:26S proteasome regulatory subunit N10